MMNNKDVEGFLKPIKPYIHKLIAIKILNKKTHMMPKIFLKNLSLLILILKSLKVWKKHYKLYTMKKHHSKKILITGSLYLVGSFLEKNK